MRNSKVNDNENDEKLWLYPFNMFISMQYMTRDERLSEYEGINKRLI